MRVTVAMLVSLDLPLHEDLTIEDKQSIIFDTAKVAFYKQDYINQIEILESEDEELITWKPE